MKKVLVIEDDRSLAGVLYERLSHNYDVWLAANLNEAYQRLESHNYDVVVADRILKNEDSTDLLGSIRSSSYKTRILCISQLGSLNDRLIGLNSGADDYLPKPFSLSELEIKVKKLSELERLESQTNLVIGNIFYNVSTRELTLNGEVRVLRKREGDIFTFLLINKGRAISRDSILSAVWEQVNTPCDTTLDVCINRLRKSLGCYAKLLKTIRGYGYVLSCEEEK